MNKKSLLGYYFLTAITFITLGIMLITKNIEIMFYYWIFIIWWPAKTTELILKSKGKYTKNREAWFGAALIIIFYLIIALLTRVFGVPAL